MTRKTPRNCVLVLAGLLPLAAAVQAQTAPNAGQLLRDALPAQRPLPRNDVAALPPAQTDSPAPLVLPAGVKVRVTGVQLSGAKTQPVQALQALMADAIGRELDFSGLQALADRITAYYRAHGYTFARAYLPAQEIHNGQLEIAVQEGQLGQLKVSVDKSLPASAQAAVVARVSRLQEGQPLRNDALEGDLLGLAALPGVRVQSVLRPGQSVGTSDLDIQVKPGDKVTGDVSLDNYGNRFTGEDRVSGHISVANPLLFGDSLDVNAVYAGGGYRYARVAWQAPVGATGWQAGLAQSYMDYALGKDFESLDAHGTALDSTLYAVKSLQRSRAARLDLNVAYDDKRYDDAANGVTSTKRADVLAIGLAGAWQHAQGASYGSMSVNGGRLQLDASDAASDAQGHRTAGHYAKLSLQAGYERALGGGFSLSVRGSSQLSSKNLDSSEKFSLGGPQGVRAYPQGEASSDDALLASAEARKDFGRWSAKLFADFGTGSAWHQPLAIDTNNHRTLSGVGVGADVRLPVGMLLQAGAALRTASAPTSDVDRSPRVWVQLTKSF